MPTVSAEPNSAYEPSGRATARPAASVTALEEAALFLQPSSRPVQHGLRAAAANTGHGMTSVGGGGTRPSKPIDDSAFLQDLLFCWMGADNTQYFTYNAPQRRYGMREGSVRQYSTFECLQDCGALAKQIDETLKKQAAEASFLQQSLRSAIRKQLTQYHYFVSSFREKGSALALGDLVQASKKVHPKLVLLHSILQETERAKGGSS